MEIQMVVRNEQHNKLQTRCKQTNEHPAYPTKRTYFIFIRNNIINVINNNQQNHGFATDWNTYTEPLIYIYAHYYDKRIETCTL